MDNRNCTTMLDIQANIMGRQDTIHPTLFQDGETAILVDTGFPGQGVKFRQAIEAAGVPFDQLKLIILTHHDLDHIGGLPDILNESPYPIQVLAYVDEKPYIEGEKPPLKLAKLEASLASQPPEARATYERMKAGFLSAKRMVDRTLADGEVLPYCGGITVLHTPGHTLGHICLYLAGPKTLVAGDALRVSDGSLILTPAGVNHDMGLYKQSLAKLAAYDIQTVICYHGGLYRGPASQRIAELAKD